MTSGLNHLFKSETVLAESGTPDKRVSLTWELAPMGRDVLADPW
jgi:hypothetical protein